MFSDAVFVERLYYQLINKGISVFWDVKSLPPGQRWEEGFANGLNSADVFVPVLSKAALASYANLTLQSGCDNVLLEQLLALELKQRDNAFLICPVFVGELENHPNLGGVMYTDFFRTNGIPACPDIVVEAVESKLSEHLQRIGKGSPQIPQFQRTVKNTLGAITSFQGVFLMGVERAAIEGVVNFISSACGDPTFFHYLQQLVARRMCAPPPTNHERTSTPPPAAWQSLSQDSSARSQASTLQNTPTRGNTPETIAVLVPGDVRHFQEHLKSLMFPDQGSGGQLMQQKWRFCLLVLIAFLRDNISDMCVSEDEEEREDEMQKWRFRCSEPSDEFVEQFEVLLETYKPLASEFKFACEFKFRSLETKPCEYCIFVLDKLVWQKLPRHDQPDWKKFVQKDWFKSENADSAEDFFNRAESFLGTTFGVGTKTRGAKILGKLIPVNSYVVFFRMDALTSLLMREHCRVQHALDSQLQSQQARAGAAEQHRSPTSTRTVSFIVSSANWHESFSEYKRPSDSRMIELVSGLQQISSLPTVLLEANQVPLSRADEVKEQVCAAGIKMKPKKSDGSDDSDGEVFRPSGTLKSSTAVRLSKVQEIFYGDVTARNVIDTYLDSLREMVGWYVDSASGKLRQVDGESIALVLDKNESFNDKCSDGQDVYQNEFDCPISRGIMTDPVTCSDKHTYERCLIEKWFLEKGTSPKTRERLAFEETPGGRKLVCKSNVSLLMEIQKFKEEKLAELEDLKQTAEGEEERRMLLNRYGYTLLDGYSVKRKGLSEDLLFDSAKTILAWMGTDSQTRLVCLTGPPASGKTVTMQQIVYAAIDEMIVQMKKGDAMPLLPVFMRAAELSTLLSEPGNNVVDFRQIVELFLDDSIRKEKFPTDVKNLILELFDLDQILICIDGLDEADKKQEFVEVRIENVVKNAMESHRHVHILLSTREHSYTHSRSCKRLLLFDVVNLQPLDKTHQTDMINRRITQERIPLFLHQLELMADKTSELLASPFLFSLIIEVYNEDSSIPTTRVGLYSKQVGIIVSRCITGRIEKGEDAPFFCAAELATFDTVLKVATHYLETLAFVCQMRLKKRDFTFSGCATEMRGRWNHSQDVLAATRELVCKAPMVRLLTGVGGDSYRFTHLTLQEYLAAKYLFRLYGHDAQQLWEQHKDDPFSRWKQEVFQFVACLLSQEIFEEFCELVLKSDDGTGAHCELVLDFLKERGDSEVVLKKVRDKLHTIRGTAYLIAGLCHPSMELRNLVLSEMISFGVPSDPFAQTDGTVSIPTQLKDVATNSSGEWHTRAAAILSLVQIAQMDHCKDAAQTETLQWVLEMLQHDRNESIFFSLVKGLGTLLKRSEESEHDEYLSLSGDNELVLLHALTYSKSKLIVEAVADLNSYSDGLLDWVLSKSNLIEDGVWPMRHLVRVFCNKTAASGSHVRALNLCRKLFGRVNALDVKAFRKQRTGLLKGLATMCNKIGADAPPMILLFLDSKFSKTIEQRARVIRIAADLNMEFVGESLSDLARCLLAYMPLGAGLGGTRRSVLDDLMQHEVTQYKVELRSTSLIETSSVFRLLQTVFKPAANDGNASAQVINSLAIFEKKHNGGKNEQGLEQESKAVKEPAVKQDATEMEDAEEVESEILSLHFLKFAVEEFKPKDLSTPRGDARRPLHLYCAVRL